MQGSNHEIWFSPITGKRFPLPRHDSKELASGTKADIEEQSGVKL
jgi:predicted RNA binding protein YcfA (HicA-like mRNA interferase family)